MGDISIKIKIADRDYPMRVSEEELDKVMLAGKMLNEKLNLFKERFGVEDKQDLLAMVTFDNFVEKLNSKNTGEGIINEVYIQKIIQLDNLISSTLS
jgi:cell division protein ZapA